MKKQKTLKKISFAINSRERKKNYNQSAKKLNKTKRLSGLIKREIQRKNSFITTQKKKNPRMF